MLFEIGLPRKFAKLSKISWKFGSFGKEFRWTKFNAVEGVSLNEGTEVAWPVGELSEEFSDIFTVIWLHHPDSNYYSM